MTNRLPSAIHNSIAAPLKPTDLKLFKQRTFFDDLAIKLNVQKPRDWFGVPNATVIKDGGSFVVAEYDGSVVQALQAVYPEHRAIWREYDAACVQEYRSPGHWRDVRNQKAFMDDLAKDLAVEKPEDWLKVQTKTVLKRGGSFLNGHYNGSFIRALQAIYPEHQEIWKRRASTERSKRHGYWADIRNQRSFLEKLAVKMNIRTSEDWYKVLVSTAVNEGGSFIKEYYNGSIIRALQAIYPNREWLPYNRFTFSHLSNQRGSKSQAVMYDMLKALIPDTPILSNYRLPLDGMQLDAKDRLKFYEFDVFLPQLSLAFEYQGEIHYFSSHLFGKSSDRQRADQIKAKFANQLGITLLSIPFWWNKSLGSLAATIRFHRPDIKLSQEPLLSSPISSVMPTKSFKYIPNAAMAYNERVNPSGWLMTEKFDGVRVFWDGQHLFVKNSRIAINVPQELAFPSVAFEGELWMGYNKRDLCVQFVKSQMKRNWQDVKVIIFDAPQATDQPYSQRLELLRQNISHNHPTLSVVNTVTCQDSRHLEQFFQEICNKSGEGVILRDPNAWYFKKDVFMKKERDEESVIMKVGPRRFQWPTGKIESIQHIEKSGNFFVVKYPPGHPEQARFASTVVSKEELFQDFFHFYVAKPPPLKKCAGCNSRLDSRSLCILTDIVPKAVHIRVAFCLNNSCLLMWTKKHPHKAFHNLIWAQPGDQHTVKQALSNTSWTIETVPDVDKL